MKKCHICSQAAVYHVTVINQGQPKELHFCEQHFRVYMQEGTASLEGVSEESEEELEASSAVEESETDDLVCPNCGITYRQFREHGRFGCAHDYVVFEEQLMPLFQNIHMHSEHTGKRPNKAPLDGHQQLKIVELKRNLADAISMEDYETAARLRDEISDLQQQIDAEPTSEQE